MHTPDIARASRLRARPLWVATAILLLGALGLLSGCADMVTAHDPAAPAAGSGRLEERPTSGKSIAFTLKTMAHDGGLVFVGVGGDIEGAMNPRLQVGAGDRVEIDLINGEPSEHDIAFPDLGVQSPHVLGLGTRTSVEFIAPNDGEYTYICTLSGHRMAGMNGSLVVGETSAATPPEGSGVGIVRPPTDLPGPLGNRAPRTVRVDLEAVEVEGRLADGATYPYMTFNGKVPGPFIRVRVGDTVEVHLKNAANSRMTHSIDLHAATGPGGGAAIMQVPPGEERSFTFKALAVGLYVYHCATPLMAQHIASGMYGMILVEPEGGLPAVDREFYIMQGEIYTEQRFGSKGRQLPSEAKLLAEQPDYFVFNGAVDALNKEAPLHAYAGETVRIFFGVGGPNFTSSFHVVGEVFDRVYNLASLTSPPLAGVQTALVPSGGAAVVEIQLDVPGEYMLMDHAMSRAEKGLSGTLMVEGEARPDLFRAGDAGK